MTAVVYPKTRQKRSRPRRPRQIDWPLIAGTLFFGALVVAAIYGPLVAPHDIYYSRSLLDGRSPPFPPSSEYVFGSDAVGRDRFSWLLIGARGSVVIALSAAALRLFIGGSLGLIAGFRGGALATLLRRVALGLSSIPGTIAALLAVIAVGVAPEQFILAFGLIGWAEPFHQARRYSRSESARPFIESARSLGLSDRRLLLRHVLPNVAPQLLTTAAFQVSAVLLLTAELALLNIFVGGSIVVDFDSRGAAILAPRIPNWGSMLAATRPIISLFSDLPSVLLPGGALLIAVLATNLFGDALASRAQRLDVYRLFSRRQLVAVLAVAIVVAVSLNAWPTRLAVEIAYAQGVDGAGARELAAELVALGPRTNGSVEAETAAVLLARRLGGTAARGRDTGTRARLTQFTIGTMSVKANAISLDDVDASGPLVYVDALTVLRTKPPDAVDGAVVLLSGVTGAVIQRLATAGARAVIVIDAVNLRPAAGTYAVPMVSVIRGALVAALGRNLPDLRSDPLHHQVLAGDARLHIETETVQTTITDVIARAGSDDPGAPAVIVVAKYDGPPGATTVWDSASAAATLVTVVDYVHKHPIPLLVIAMATAGDHQEYAGLHFGLEQLSADEQSRVQAILVVGPQLSQSIELQTQPVPGAPSGIGRMAARLDDSLGARVKSQLDPDLLRAIGFVRVTALPLVQVARGPDSDPGAATLHDAAVVTLVSLAYVPRHIAEMH